MKVVRILSRLGTWNDAKNTWKSDVNSNELRDRK